MSDGTYDERFIAHIAGEVIKRLELVPQEKPHHYRLSYGRRRVSELFELDPALSDTERLRKLGMHIEKFMVYE